VAENNDGQNPKYKKIFEGVDQLSLGISMVIAVVLGVGLGIGMQYLFEVEWVLWLGVAWGVLAAGLNVYKAYKEQLKSWDSIKDDPKYKHQNLYKDEDEDDDDKSY